MGTTYLLPLIGFFGRVRSLWSRSGCSVVRFAPCFAPPSAHLPSLTQRQVLSVHFWRLNALLIFAATLFSGCNKAAYQPFVEQKAQLGEVTRTGLELRNLPEARDPLVVAVYSFRDQTGQYKPTEGGSSFSTAVTQGGTSILIRALEE